MSLHTFPHRVQLTDLSSFRVVNFAARSARESSENIRPGQKHIKIQLSAFISSVFLSYMAAQVILTSTYFVTILAWILCRKMFWFQVVFSTVHVSCDLPTQSAWHSPVRGLREVETGQVLQWVAMATVTLSYTMSYKVKLSNNSFS